MYGSSYFKLKKTLADTLAAIGQPLHADEVIAYILSGLGSEYESLVASLKVKADLTLDDVFSYMVGFEHRQEVNKSDLQIGSSSSANFTESGCPPSQRNRGGQDTAAIREDAKAVATGVAQTRAAIKAEVEVGKDKVAAAVMEAVAMDAVVDSALHASSLANRGMLPSSATAGSTLLSMVKRNSSRRPMSPGQAPGTKLTPTGTRTRAPLDHITSDLDQLSFRKH
jgi:hypothetical protein